MKMTSNSLSNHAAHKAACAVNNHTSAAPLLPLEDFFRNSQEAAYQISPDGRHLSYLAPYEERMNVYVREAPSNLPPTGEANDTLTPDTTQAPSPSGEGWGEAARRLTDETERSVAGYMWADNERILYMKDVAGDENYQLYGVNIDGSDRRAYTDFPGVRTSLIDDLEDVPDEIIIGLNRRNPEVFDPYRLNLKTGELTMLAENPGNIQGWMTDHAGRLRAATAIVDGVNTQILYRDTEDEPFRPVLTTNFKDVVAFLEFTPDNRQVYAITNLHRDRTALVLMNPADCTEVEQLFTHERYDIASISYSRRRGKLLSAYCTGHKEPVRHFFDEEERQLRERIKAHFPHHRVGVADCDKAEEHYLLYVGSDRTRGAYYYYDAATDCATKIADTAPWLHEEDMVEMQPVTYTARDGLEIEAYLSLPAPSNLPPRGRLAAPSTSSNGDSPSSNDESLTSCNNESLPLGGRLVGAPLPVVVHPHGGPWARDTWGFSSEVQFLCNRGYAVFQMNFRSSTGYGRRFLEAGYKQWGLKMQDDITDGVQWLIREGIADPQRIAIYGGSYGGYATLAGLAFTPDLYACGVDYVGVSNLFTFMKTIPPYWRPLLEMMYEQVGDPEADREQLAATSPALHADQIKAPLFVAQGANDPRVNKAESDQMVEALRSRGVEVEYMVKDNEGHGFQNQENRFDFYRAMERFLARHLGGRCEEQA